MGNFGNVLGPGVGEAAWDDSGTLGRLGDDIETLGVNLGGHSGVTRKVAPHVTPLDMALGLIGTHKPIRPVLSPSAVWQVAVQTRTTPICLDEQQAYTHRV